MTGADRADADGMSGVRAAVARQIGVERPAAASVDAAALTRFSARVPDALDASERADLLARARALDPWLQGPFWLGGDLVVGGTWRCDLRWQVLGEHVPADLTGRRVLDVGSNAGYDAFMFSLRGGDVVACEPGAFHDQAVFLESIYRRGIDLRQIGWEGLDAARDGRFDLVHCNGLLYHEIHPMALLQRLRSLVADGGRLILGSMMLASAELSEYIRFVPNAYWGDPTWWFVPGRLALRWMLATAGLRVEEEFGLVDGPPGEFPTVNGYFLLSPVEGAQAAPAPGG